MGDEKEQDKLGAFAKTDEHDGNPNDPGASENQIRVRLGKHKLHGTMAFEYVQLCLSATVGKVKQELKSKVPGDPSKQSWFHNNVPLEDGCSLSQYNIRNGDIIEIRLETQNQRRSDFGAASFDRFQEPPPSGPSNLPLSSDRSQQSASSGLSSACGDTNVSQSPARSATATPEASRSLDNGDMGDDQGSLSDELIKVRLAIPTQYTASFFDVELSRRGLIGEHKERMAPKLKVEPQSQIWSYKKWKNMDNELTLEHYDVPHGAHIEVKVVDTSNPDGT